MPPVNISTTVVAAGLSGVAGAITQANLADALDTAPDLTVFVRKIPTFTSHLPDLHN